MLPPPSSDVSPFELAVGDKFVRLVSAGGLPAKPLDNAGLPDSVGGAVNDAPTSGAPPKLLNPPTFRLIGFATEVKLGGGGENRELLCAPEADSEGDAPSDPEREGVPCEVAIGEGRPSCLRGPLMMASTLREPAIPNLNLVMSDLFFGFGTAGAAGATTFLVCDTGAAAGALEGVEFFEILMVFGVPSRELRSTLGLRFNSPPPPPRLILKPDFSAVGVSVEGVGGFGGSAIGGSCV
jgi:hypothetical protein